MGGSQTPAWLGSSRPRAPRRRPTRRFCTSLEEQSVRGRIPSVCTTLSPSSRCRKPDIEALPDGCAQSVPDISGSDLHTDINLLSVRGEGWKCEQCTKRCQQRPDERVSGRQQAYDVPELAPLAWSSCPCIAQSRNKIPSSSVGTMLAPSSDSTQRCRTFEAISMTESIARSRSCPCVDIYTLREVDEPRTQCSRGADVTT